MAYTIDARGLACPQPVVLTKKALEDHDVVDVIVNDAVASINVKKLASALGYTFSEEARGQDTVITITKGSSCALADDVIPSTEPIVVVISAETMGTGDDTLGRLLMRSFIHTLVDTRPMPGTVILYNAGVKLAVEGADTLDDLKALADAGAKVLSCGTCLNYYGLKERLAVGEVSNMYDIASILLGASRIVRV